jgi:hypothetical protein
LAITGGKVARILACSVLGVIGLALATAASAQVPMSSDAHLGVNSCAGSTCHGAASRTKKMSAVVQDEALIWQSYDKHAKAYTVLQGTLGRRIAANLGIGPAEKAQECLICHADNVPVAMRGVQFHIEDGVGCEACHGGSARWLGPHATGLTRHADLVANEGLYPTETPIARAKLCLSCHEGDDERFITHKIMGAGHPRLSFELQTYTQIEPAHFVIDDKYRFDRTGAVRKVVAPGVQVWAVGQALALERLASELTNPKHAGDGVFPELIFFDCQSCHHTTSNLRWEKRASTGLAPGLPHLNDANAVMLRTIAARVAPDLSRRLESDVRTLHLALSAGIGRPAAAAPRVAEEAGQMAQMLSDHSFNQGDMRALILALAQISQTSDMSDYAAAEQATMAFASIIYTLKMDGDVDTAQYDRLRAALEQCYGATRNQDAYDPRRFAAAAEAIESATPTW